MKQKKNISKELHKAYWRGVTDVIGCIAIAITYVVIFVIWWQKGG